MIFKEENRYGSWMAENENRAHRMRDGSISRLQKHKVHYLDRPTGDGTRIDFLSGGEYFIG